MPPKIVGWDQIYQLELQNIHKPIDIIILLIHWNLVINNSFKCCGLGNEKYISRLDKELMSELLPDGWNFSSHYNIRYIHNDSLFILIAIEMKTGLFFVYLLQPDREVLSSITLRVAEIIFSEPKNNKIPNLFNNYEMLLNAIQNELVEKVLIQRGKQKKENPAIVNKRENIHKRQSISPNTTQYIPHWKLPHNYRNQYIESYSWEEMTMPGKFILP